MTDPDEEAEGEQDVERTPRLMDERVADQAPEFATQHLVDIQLHHLGETATVRPVIVPGCDLANEHETVEQDEKDGPLRPREGVGPPLVLAVVVAVVDSHSRPLRWQVRGPCCSNIRPPGTKGLPGNLSVVMRLDGGAWSEVGRLRLPAGFSQKGVARLREGL